MSPVVRAVPSHEITIGALLPAHHDQVAQLLASAFAATPLHRAVFHGACDRQPLAFFRACLREPRGVWLTARDEDRVIGVAHWGPQSDAWQTAPTPAPGTLGASVDRALRRVLCRWLSATAPTGSDAAAGPVALGPMAVWPVLQRQGVGSLLMERYCAFLDAAGAWGCLETDQRSNLAFYRRFGFAATGAARQNGLVVYGMQRPPSVGLI